MTEKAAKELSASFYTKVLEGNGPYVGLDKFGVIIFVIISRFLSPEKLVCPQVLPAYYFSPLIIDHNRSY